MKIVQVKLKSVNETLITWVDKRPDLKVGAIVTLKDWADPQYPDSVKHWEVIEIWANEHEAADFDFHRKWDNNNYDKHKGLGLNP
jgi:hypothetical protein